MNYIFMFNILLMGVCIYFTREKQHTQRITKDMSQNETLSEEKNNNDAKEKRLEVVKLLECSRSDKFIKKSLVFGLIFTYCIWIISIFLPQ